MPEGRATLVAKGGAMTGVAEASPNWNNCRRSIARSRPATLSTTSDALRSTTGLPASVTARNSTVTGSPPASSAALFRDRPRDGDSGEEQDARTTS